MRPVVNHRTRGLCGVTPTARPPPAGGGGFGFALGASFCFWLPALVGFAARLAKAGLGPEQAGPVCAAAAACWCFVGRGRNATTRLCAGASRLVCAGKRPGGPGGAGCWDWHGHSCPQSPVPAPPKAFAVGTDIDPTAVACAKAHAELDNVSSPGDSVAPTQAARGFSAVIGGGGPSLANISLRRRGPPIIGVARFFDLVGGRISSKHRSTPWRRRSAER